MNYFPPSLLLVSLTAILIFTLLIIVLLKIYKGNWDYEKYLHKRAEYTWGNSRLLAHVKLEVQEETMNYISKELHDNIGHSLALIQMELKNLKGEVLPPLKEDVYEISMMVSKLIEDNRNIFESLRSVQGHNYLLSETLKSELEKVKKAAKFDVTFQLVGEEFRFKPEDQIVLLRMFQEVLHNVLKHSEASRIDVAMAISKKLFTLKISDNGKGFNIHKLQVKGLGLKNLEERAILIGAKVNVISRIRNGTTVEISKPLKTKEYATS